MSAALRFLRFETFTGWHMLAVMVLFFGTIISVNLTMAYYAGSSWSGLLVKNTYVASQKFDEQVAADREMQQRGWKSQLTLEDSGITYHLADADGRPVPADTVTVSLGRPVGVLQDRIVALSKQGDDAYFSDLLIEPGLWIARIRAERDGALVYRETQRLEVGSADVER